MANASHQPDSMTDLVADMLDGIINRRDHVAIDFEPAENGCMEETHDSLKRRIEAMWGFKASAISLMEADMALFEIGRVQFNVYKSIRFSVNGKGWSTDFKTIARDTAYDEKE